MARGVMRRKLAALREALDCSFFTEEHAFVLAMMPDNTGRYSAQVAVLDEKIAALCEPYQRQVARLDEIPGFGVTNAQDLIGETGTDMTAFPAAGHLCSRARVALGEAAVTAGRTQTFPGARLRRLVRHMPKKKAQGAVMRTQLVIACALLSGPGASYRELGPGYYDERAGTQRQARGHIRSLERLGYKVTLEPVDPETGELTAKAG